jgi:choline transport protein
MASSEKKEASLDSTKAPMEEGEVLTPKEHPANRRVSLVSKEGTIVNASGHRDQLQRHYGFWSICGLALNIDNAWIAFAGSLSVAVANGGPPGILYEFIVASLYYAFIGASIAELASAIPSSGGVYHWASVTPGPRYGRMLGFFCGSLNFFGKTFMKQPLWFPVS